MTKDHLLDIDFRPSPVQNVTEDITGLRTLMVNLYFIGRPGFGPWFLVDTGIPGSAEKIRKFAETTFGAGTRPQAIILTHGHFDHVGSLEDLLKIWDVPVYAHRLELPYLTGRSNYPPPDPTVGGGAMALFAKLYPREGINIAGKVRALPEDGSIPGLAGWEWIHTPGHTAGHISLFRRRDRALIVGDAFVTTKQESAMAVITQRRELHGPPAYFTSDWRAAWRSVERLSALNPSVAATGHGLPMRGEVLHRELRVLARTFLSSARPRRGRYVLSPAVADERGVISVPPPLPTRASTRLTGLGLLALAAATLFVMFRRGGVSA